MKGLISRDRCVIHVVLYHLELRSNELLTVCKGLPWAFPKVIIYTTQNKKTIMFSLNALLLSV